MYIKKILQNNIRYFAILCVLTVLFISQGTAHAATLQITSSASKVSVGDTTTLYVVLNSEGVAVNNAESTITFPTDVFDVVSLSKSGSIFSLWVEEPYFSNTTGIVTFNGGLPTPGFNGGQGPIVSITVRAKKAGQAEFAFSSAAVRANDGLGTDVLNNKISKSITVQNAEAPTVIPAVVTPAATVDLSLQITSPTHASQEQWYTDKDPLFRWSIPSGVDAIQTTVDKKIGGVPHVTYAPPIKEKSIKDLEDGIWYFKARARANGVWGPVSTYITRIDTTAPLKRSAAFAFDTEKKSLTVTADIIDETSGLDHFEIYVNDTLLKKVPAEDFIHGMYSLPYHTPGDNTVRLVAVDRAGNSVESSGTFNVPTPVATEPEVAVKPATNNDQVLLLSVGSFSAPAVYILIISILCVIIVALVSFYAGRSYHKLRRTSKVRTAIGKGDNAKVLSLLKKRLEKHLELLQDTRHNRILSKEEKDIKEAIEADLDEVDRAIEDLQ